MKLPRVASLRAHTDSSRPVIDVQRTIHDSLAHILIYLIFENTYYNRTRELVRLVSAKKMRYILVEDAHNDCDSAIL